MVENKSKTKTAMLQELESIKGLLREDDDIPILQEIISDPADLHLTREKQSPLKQRDLQELHHQFEALSQTIAGSAPSAKAPPPKSAASLPATPTSKSLLDAFTQASRQTQTASHAATPRHQQPSLFSEPDVRNLPDWEVREPEVTASTDVTEPADITESADVIASADISEKTQIDNDQPNHVQRPSLAKASGENPFLPQHIRARLHGNNPPPSFDYSALKGPGALKGRGAPTVKPTQELPARQRLIDDVITAIMPKMEQELRQRLDEMTREELDNLRDSD
jgi:hypothetical protein